MGCNEAKIGRSWCYTLNNPTESEIEYIKTLDNCAVHVAAHEVGESGTPHIQGYIRFHKPQKLSWWKRRLPRAHCELRRVKDSEGNPIPNSEARAFEYCLKDVPDDKSTLVIEVGSPAIPQPPKGASRDEEAAQVIEKIENGMSYRDIRSAHKVFCFWHRRNVLDYKKDERALIDQPDRDPPVNWAQLP